MIKSLDQAIIDNLDTQISIMVKILNDDLIYLESISDKTEDQILYMNLIKQKLKEVDKFHSHG